MNARKRHRGDDRGAAAVEFAFVLPLLALLIFGIVDFGFAFNTQISLTQAAREGVRREALDSGDPVQTTRDAFLNVIGDSADLTVDVEPCPNDDDRARVRATFPYSSFFLPMLDMDLTGEAVMRCGG